MSNQKRIVKINSRKFDGKIHRSWNAEFLQQTASLLTFVGEFENEVKHPHLGVIRRGTVSHEFYWLNRGYNVFRFHEPEGGLRNFYCNINLPPKFENDVLDYVDLDIDVLVWKDFSFEILDSDEFEENAVAFDYPKTLRDDVDGNLQEILSLIKQKSFPFDYEF